MRVDINGNPLEVEVLGPEGAPVMIVHHGAPGLGSRAEPRTSFGPFSDRMRVVVFDARGSGASGETPPFTHAQWVADVDALREWVGAERIVMAGGSYGGFISMEYAIAHPDRVQALVLRDTAADSSFDERARQNALRSNRVQLDMELYDRLFSGRCRDDADLEAGWRMIVPLYDHDLSPEKVEARLRSTVYHHRAHNAAFSENMPRYDIRDRLPSITAPTLVTVGRDDWITPVAAAEEIARLIPSSRLVVFEESGHSPQLEEPERFQRVVREFLVEAGVLETAEPLAR
ncbi:MAG TPA: alpha/beta hydrolase [Candidatus Dormibacteraeota bacterium]|nr:alpha/beta hydrolase [Candidatus Dormibacteraeota bacterium]